MNIVHVPIDSVPIENVPIEDAALRYRYLLVSLFLLLFLASNVQAQVVAFRVNTGGPITMSADGSYPDWSEDQQEALDPPPIQFANRGTNSPYVNAALAGDRTAGRNRADEIVFLDPVNAAVSTLLFNSQRWDPLEPEQHMIWSFPAVEGREYQIVLYFTELFGEGLTSRVFDIAVEGETVVDDLNILAETSNLDKVVVARTITVSETDGDEVITIEFLGEVGVPIISAIEVFDMSSENGAPTADNPGDQFNDPEDNVLVPVLAADPDQDALTFSATGLPPGLSISADGVISGVIDASAGGAYSVRVLVEDDGSPARGVYVPFTWNVDSFAPIVENPIGTVQLLDTAAPLEIELSTVFTDPMGLDLTFDVFENTNTEVVDASEEGGTLTLTVSPGTLGSSVVTVRATNEDDKFVDDVFTVIVDGGTPAALVRVTGVNGLGASTYNAGSISIENLSTGTLRIEQVTIDLSTSVFPDMVYDPVGAAGDVEGRCVQPDSGGADTGFEPETDPCADPFSMPYEDGFLAATLAFSDFDPQEIFTFSTDVDPTSIRGSGGVGEAGAVSGVELMGASVTVTFTGGATITNDLFRVETGGLGGAEAEVWETPAEAPMLAIQGTDETSATFTEAAQTVLVNGPPGAFVRLIQVDGTLNVAGVPGGGYDIDPFEANQAMAVPSYSGTIGENGVLAIDVDLKMTQPGNGLVGGLNYFIAAINEDGFDGRTSNVLVMEFLAESMTEFTAGWNLIGLSYEVTDNDYLALYGDVSPPDEPFFWDETIYAQTSAIQTGTGYWINVPEAGVVDIAGTEIPALTLPLLDGWNLIAGPSCSVDEGEIVDPSAILLAGTLWGYDGLSYVNTTSIDPNRGYWLFASAPGTITLDCAGPGIVAKQDATADEALDGFGAIAVRDASDRSRTLYFGAAIGDEGHALRYGMPPASRQLAFDARFAGDRWLIEEEAGVIRIQSDRYPVHLELLDLPRTAAAGYRAELLVAGQVVATHAIATGDVLTIDDEAVEAVRILIAEGQGEALPESFALHGNYPNPFNPTTTVSIDLPESAEVRMDVYDLLGRNVLSIPARSLEAGAARQLQIDASSLASGTYIYRVTATMTSGVHAHTGQMTLLK